MKNSLISLMALAATALSTPSMAQEQTSPEGEFFAPQTAVTGDKITACQKDMLPTQLLLNRNYQVERTDAQAGIICASTLETDEFGITQQSIFEAYTPDKTTLISTTFDAKSTTVKTITPEFTCTASSATPGEWGVECTAEGETHKWNVNSPREIFEQLQSGLTEAIDTTLMIAMSRAADTDSIAVQTAGLRALRQ